MPWLAKAPANIALIKYMGKKESAQNIPMNASLSYTLDKLLSVVSIEQTDEKLDRWLPLTNDHFKEQLLISPAITEQGQSRFIKHLHNLKAFYGIKEAFLIRSANTFPMDAGLASSASSFAALTKAANLALSELSGKNLLDSPEKLARFSQMGSGSSCRSFFKPFALWEENSICELNFPFNLESMVVVASEQKKAVSSSLAHQLIKTSPNFKSRVATATTNLTELISALEQRDWQKAYDITWREFIDMHQLFHTAKPPFSYINQHSEKILTLCQQFWRDKGDGPLVTMDAGANVHLLFRREETKQQDVFCNDYLKEQYRVII